MLIFIVKLIVSPIAISIDFLMVVIAFLLWDSRFLTHDDRSTLILDKVWTKKKFR